MAQDVLASPSDGISFIDGLKTAYGFDTTSFKSVQKVDYSIGFASVTNDSAQFNVCYTTDGTVATQNFIFLDDDKTGFPQFHPAPIVRDERAEPVPGHRDRAQPACAQVDDGYQHPASAAPSGDDEDQRHVSDGCGETGCYAVPDQRGPAPRKLKGRPSQVRTCRSNGSPGVFDQDAAVAQNPQIRSSRSAAISTSPPAGGDQSM